MVSSHLLKHGYRYLNIDDCWQVARNEMGLLKVDEKLFPSGMLSLSRYVHSKGLKLGLYTDRGKLTCQRRPGSYRFEKVDAQTFASWEVDFLKEDSCYAPIFRRNKAFEEYATMRDALNETRRPILFALCGWRPWYAPHGHSLGNMWRIAPDNVNWNVVYVAAQEMNRLAKYSGPGGWNDPDFVLGSNPAAPSYLLPYQARTQFSLWCIISAPLILSSPDVLKVGSFDHKTVTNALAIRINQDTKMSNGGRLAFSTCPKLTMPTYLAPFITPKAGCTQVWYKSPLGFKSNTVAILLLNWDPKETLSVHCDSACMQKAGIPKGASILSVRDVWGKKNDGGLTTLQSFGGPGKIETRLEKNGGSAFLLVEWSLNNKWDQQGDVVSVQ